MGEWLLYGANGYTGRLIAEEAAERGARPVLAGRSAAKVQPLAEELDLPWRAFELGAPDALRAELADPDLVLHCAGPFSATAEPMIRACLATGTHYLDITGEIAVFELAHALGDQAREAGVVLCPGVGFDVIPTDCVAARLHEALPDATHLALGFQARGGGFSPGTARTSVEALGQGGRIRRAGAIEVVSLAHASRRVDFGAGETLAITIPWGDVATAYYTTGIPNVEVYVPTSPRSLRCRRLLDLLRPVLGTRLAQGALKRRVAKTVQGPSAQQRATGATFVWGEARDEAGERRVARIQVANGYLLTVNGSLAVIDHVLGNDVAGGYYTPSQLAGAELVAKLPGSGELVVGVE